MNNDQSLSYYQSRPKEAFLDCFVGDTSFEKINDEVYRGVKFYIPINTRKKVRFLKKYFAYIDEGGGEWKRRKNWVEFGETAVTILQRIDSFFMTKHIFVAGSPLVCQIPWAIFGNSSRWCQHKFEKLCDISEFYRNFLHGKCYPLQLHFNRHPTFLFKLSERFSKFPLNNPNFWMGVALNLVYDLIHNCAPDCNEVFELFTNDYRVGPGDFPDHEFHDLRFKILGVHPDPLKNLPRVGGYSSRSWKPRKSKIEIEDFGECFDLALGEKTATLTKPMLCLPPAPKDRKLRDEELGPWRPPLQLPLETWNALPKDMCDLMCNPYFAMKHSRGMAGLAARISPITPDMI